MDSIERTLGEHGAKLETLGSSMSRVEGKLEILIANENKREGGKKLILGLAAIAGVFGGGVADAFVTHFLK